MPRVKVKVDGYECNKCDHIWIPRINWETPGKCPNCQTRKWDWDKDTITGKLTRPKKGE